MWVEKVKPIAFLAEICQHSRNNKKQYRWQWFLISEEWARNLILRSWMWESWRAVSGEFYCQLDTTQGHLRRENLNWKITSIRLVCCQMTDVGGPSPALQGTIPRLIDLGCRRKVSETELKSEPVRSVLYGFCFSFLPWALSLVSRNDGLWTGNIKLNKPSPPEVALCHGVCHDNGEPTRWGVFVNLSTNKLTHKGGQRELRWVVWVWELCRHLIWEKQRSSSWEHCRLRGVKAR